MFKEVKDYWFAEVNSKGEIRSSITKRIHTPYVDKDGYLRCKIWVSPVKSQGIYVHRAIAKNFIPNPENKPLVNHINGIRDDNRVENLEWVTPKENSQHGVRLGNFPKGERAFAAKHSDKKVLEICQLLQEGYSQVEVSKRVDVPTVTVGDIARGVTWTHLSKNFKIPKTKPKITKDIASNIKRLLKEGLADGEIVLKISHPRVNKDTVRNIRLGKTFKHVK